MKLISVQLLLQSFLLIDFQRAASHELKTPVIALNATLENMIFGVGKYKDYDTYLPECREMTGRLADMIHDTPVILADEPTGNLVYCLHYIQANLLV